MINNNLKFIGLSGHSYQCIEIAIKLKYKILGYYDLKPNHTKVGNLLFFGNDSINIPINENLFISIGDNKIRKQIFEKHYIFNQFINLIHHKAIISEKVIYGSNILIASGAIVNPDVELYNGVIINSGSIIEHECSIGEFSHIAPGAVLAGNVEVGSLSFIGANSVVKQGVKIGNNVIVGAGTVVLKDVPDNSTIVGNPGKIIK